ncbi:FAD-binding domain-containing protein [Xylariomycetidae sp. FL2044]|nr:FAD-binding domain-containing protein [Xylariomycetidae sp. FL2044]
MGLKEFLDKLDASSSPTSLSADAKIWTDPSKADFQDSLARWTDVGKKQPGAIIFPATEDDIVTIVKLAVRTSVPFVPKAGGHSGWSTIGESGFVLDLSLMRRVQVDTENETATASAGALVGDVVKAVDEKGYCAVTGTVNTVGFIPSTIGGGITVLAPLVGYGSDNVVSARLVTAQGEAVTVSDAENPELLYAIRGAGQFFGVVTSLTVRIHAVAPLLGTPDGTVWSATLVFDVARAVDVARAAVEVKRSTTRSYCLFGVLPAPPLLDPIIMVVLVHLGSRADGEAAFQPLLDLGPLAVPASSEVPFGRMNEAYAAFEGKGGFKRWLAVGLTSMAQFRPEDMARFVEARAAIAEKYPAAKPTGFVLEFTSDAPADPHHRAHAFPESAWSHRDVVSWAQLLCWAGDEEAVDYAHGVAEELAVHLRKDQPRDQYSIYGNFSRTVPIEERYKGAGRLAKLRALKAKWDPEGVFTRELL